jgi:Protein kinase domain
MPRTTSSIPRPFALGFSPRAAARLAGTAQSSQETDQSGSQNTVQVRSASGLPSTRAPHACSPSHFYLMQRLRAMWHGLIQGDTLSNITDCAEGRDLPADVPEPVVPTMDISQFQLEKEAIGHGKYGVVLRATWVDGKDTVLCAAKRQFDGPKKVIKNKPSAAAIIAAKNEFEIGKNINHKNIIKSYGYDELNNIIYMELADKNLFDIFGSADIEIDKTSDLIKFSLKNMLEGVFHLYRKRIAHYDLHVSNFLYKKGRGVLVADFGWVGKVPRHEYAILNPNAGCADYDKVNPFKDIITLMGELSSEGCIEKEIVDLIFEMSRFAEKEMACVMLARPFYLFEQREERNKFIALIKAVNKMDTISLQEYDSRMQTLIQKYARPQNVDPAASG